MKLSKQKLPTQLAFNMTPMIDIVFLLIIFFMTVSQITRTADFPLSLPIVTEGDTQSRTATVTINIDQQGKIIIGGQEQPLEKALLVIQKRLRKLDNDPQRIKIQLRCDRNCQCQHVSKLLTRLASLGFTNVRSAVSDS